MIVSFLAWKWKKNPSKIDKSVSHFISHYWNSNFFIAHKKIHPNRTIRTLNEFINFIFSRLLCLNWKFSRILDVYIFLNRYRCIVVADSKTGLLYHFSDFFRLFPCALKAIYVFCLLIRFRHCLPNIGNWIYFVSALSFADASIYRQTKMYRMLYGFRKQRNIEEPYCLFYFISLHVLIFVNYKENRIIKLRATVRFQMDVCHLKP